MRGNSSGNSTKPYASTRLGQTSAELNAKDMSRRP